jgi:hypothetical protein
MAKWSPASVKKFAEKQLGLQNPDAEISFDWSHGPVKVKWADGSPGISGVVKIKAPGFAPKPVVVSVLDGAISLR